MSSAVMARSPCLVLTCRRMAPGTPPLICAGCWKYVSPAMRLALADHHRIAEGRVTGELLSWLANPYEEGRAFLLWSWRYTLALAAWESGYERSWRRDPAYEQFTGRVPAISDAGLRRLVA